jgi:addiction module HigA family antidote
LKELSISAAELARQIDVPVNRVTGIIDGQPAITADMALRLGHWFGTSSEFWLICKSCMSCAWRAKTLATGWKNFPSSRNASAARPGEPPNSSKGAPLTMTSDDFSVPQFPR